MKQNKKKYMHIYANAGERNDLFLDMILKECGSRGVACSGFLATHGVKNSPLKL